ncbi:MAG: DUF4097 family beta strand repeat-containing protein [Blastocatellia bacterium]
MKLKTSIAFFAIAGLSLLLITGGCRHRRTQSSAASSGRGAEAGKAEVNIAPSDATPDPKAVEAKLESNDSEGVDFPEKEEIRRSYNLSPGALVNIYGINGRVKIETAGAKTAEVLIIRSAKKREDLEFRRVNIEHEPRNLTIRVENDRKSIFSALGSIPEGRQRVILRLPKEVDLETSGVNGNFSAGEIRGRMELRGISGEVKVARVTGNTEVSGVNGGIDITFAPLVGKKVEMNGVNGNIDLRFEGDVNADVNTWGVNGNVEADLPNVDRTDAEPRRGRIKARIGTGGTKIEAHGVNGNINLMKAAKSDTTTAKAAGK